MWDDASEVSEDRYAVSPEHKHAQLVRTLSVLKTRELIEACGEMARPTCFRRPRKSFSGVVTEDMFLETDEDHSRPQRRGSFHGPIREQTDRHGNAPTPHSCIEPRSQLDVVQRFVDQHPGIDRPHSERLQRCAGHQASPTLGSFRDLIPLCAYCQYQAPDQNACTMICNGCGPASTVRYCSLDHLILDSPRHLAVCRTTPLSTRMDPRTLDAHLSECVPHIQDIRGWTTVERTRQLVHSTHQHATSDYALFSDLRSSVAAGRAVPMALIATNHIRFLPSDPRKDIVNRLLNIAFHDNCQLAVLMLLFRILRQKLVEEELWDVAVQKELTHQFRMEFGSHIDAWTRAPREDVDMSSEWYGPYGHERAADALENVTPILRAWRREHPMKGLTQGMRYFGMGFLQATMGTTEVSQWGRGWRGFGEPVRATNP